MNKKLQEFKYDLDRETDDEKSHELIEEFVRVKQSKDRLERYGTIEDIERENNKSILKDGRAIGESDECDCEKCANKEEWHDIIMNNCDKDIEKDEISKSENIARKFHVLFNKAEDDEKNKLCEGRIIKSPGVPAISIEYARKVLRDALDNDSDFKHSYMANIKMFLYGRTGDLINDQDSYDLLDYILKE